MDDELFHIGTSTSGRYPKGSGDDPIQRYRNFVNLADSLRKQGLGKGDIAKGMGMTTNEFIKRNSVAKSELFKADQAIALDLKAQGFNNVQIGEKMGGKNESSVREYFKEGRNTRSETLNKTVNVLKDAVKERTLIDVGANAELHLGVTRDGLKAALSKLEEEGYQVRPIYVDQLGTGGNKKTTVLVLSPPGDKYKEIKDLYDNQDKIKMVVNYHVKEDGSTSFGIQPPSSISLDRVHVKYKEDGGADKDGVIELRRGVDELSLGNSKYAQVRIKVGDTHYIKGMAMYADDLPKGVDILVNSNKSKEDGKLGSLKKLKTISKDDPTIDPDNPFGAQIKENGQRYYIDSKGKERLSPVNKVNEEGDWEEWKKTLSSQMLAKQSVPLATKQLGITYGIKKEEFDEIMSLTNPAVKKTLLASFADDCDSSSVHLKAAALPRQGAHVILPVTDMKDTEVYAPNYRPGESVVLIRYPHGGTFEIPSLTVNNNHPTAKKLIGTAKDAIGISPKVAEKLSGADFDGDTVLVIPNKDGKAIMSKASLKELTNFDTKAAYPAYPGMPKMTPKAKQTEMGKASNLITDMTIGRASDEEIARAVKHSMVVIDAEKHNLDYKRSFEENGIAGLKKRYQGSTTGGASTLLSRASSEIDVNKRKEKTVYKSVKNMTPEELVQYKKTGKPILNMTPKELADHNEGKKVWEDVGTSYFKPLTTTIRTEKSVSEMSPKELEKHNSGKKVYVSTKVKKEKAVSDMTPEELVKYKAGKKIWEYSTTPTYNTVKSTKMAEVQDAFELSSGTAMESVYATHANKLKALANSARKADLNTPPAKYSDTANKVYKKEVSTLKGKLNVALKNAPLERQAQMMAGAIIKAKKLDNPDMEPSDIKKATGQALDTARRRIGSKKELVVIEPKEWEAIQAGAVSNGLLVRILANTDIDKVKQLAMPRNNTVSGLTPAREARIRSMLASGNNQRDIADALGVSLEAVKQLM